MSSETSSPSLSPEAALALLPLPDVDDLTAEQRRGAVCVWGASEKPLTTEAAIDLGERQDADGTSWFPRACRDCARREATYALHYHTTMCEQCVDDAPRCVQGDGLLRLVREMRRP